ncbi:hypothetical protein SAMN04487906_1270 [Zhouia amylolytica]|uniref:Four helix bundle protein n=2 Tax=Zhouia amylolytica TaxID=376730 RepID=W2UP27_9FLAO|nr:hypothetical protein [Zhouia amylolytica]ETN95226.1 hypothetical protein P278_19810 [Zhouia amylolytica AD3]MCQ0111937.1 hypothetical protein [Zhouia amylolytica]SFS67424.1 hypothetical protein SAMN04487906_1270 [Zhouia amylolytica]
MAGYNSNSITQHEIYKKAINIFGISRAIASYVGDDQSILHLHNSEIKKDNYSAYLVMESMSLSQKIIKLHISKEYSSKRKHIKSLEKAISKLNSYCEYLEYNYSQAKDYIHLLRREISLFSKEKFKWEKELLEK